VCLRTDQLEERKRRLKDLADKERKPEKERHKAGRRTELTESRDYGETMITESVYCFLLLIVNLT
jgi:hypothetical protein